MEKIIWYRGKPFFLYKVISTRPNVIEFKKKLPNVRLYYQPILNSKTGKTFYAIYLDKKIGSW